MAGHQSPQSSSARCTLPPSGSGRGVRQAVSRFVGACREIVTDRQRQRATDEPVATQVAKAVDYLIEAGALSRTATEAPPQVPPSGGAGPVICVVAEPDNDDLAAELCGLAARLAATVHGSTVLLAASEIDAGSGGFVGCGQIGSDRGHLPPRRTWRQRCPPG